MMLKERVAAAMAHAKLTPAMLIAKTGATKGAVSFWLNGKTKNLKSETALSISLATGVAHEWLITGSGEMLATSSRAPHQEVNALTPEAVDLAVFFDMLTDRIDRAMAQNVAMTEILRLLALRADSPIAAPNAIVSAKKQAA